MYYKVCKPPLNSSIASYTKKLTNRSELSFIKQLQQSFNPNAFTCQGCGCKGNSRKSSSYRRYFITLENYNSGNIDDQFIYIDCIYCKTCNYHHANLYDLIIPYRSYSLIFIMKVLSDYAKHACSITELCSKWHIAISTLYSWRNTFRQHYQMWCCAMLLHDKPSDSINEILYQPNNHTLPVLFGSPFFSFSVDDIFLSNCLR